LIKNVLIISPHIDDGILGCGATIVKLIHSGMKVHYIALSTGEITNLTGFKERDLINECESASQLIGIEKLILKKFEVRKLSHHRQDILEILIQLRNSLVPYMVFMPSSQSIHQDHKVVYLEGIRAFKHTSCYGYDLPWDTDNFKTSSFFVLNENQLNLKIKALGIFKSVKNKIYMDKDFVKGLARVRGTQINVAYAEAFEVIRNVY
jgi:LmbE family N-acetylglucosaminyl deacetylase